MSNPVVVIPDYLTECGIEREVFGDKAGIRLLGALHEDQILDSVADAEIVLLFHDISITHLSLSKMNHCKAIVRCGVGYNNVDIVGAGKAGIVVCNVPDYGTEDVADHAMMLLLAVTRRLLPSHEGIRAGAWDSTVVFGTPRLRGKTLGLIGCGRIGAAMALRAKAFGMEVCFYDPHVKPGTDKMLGITRVWSIEELFQRSPFISVHCWLDTESKHIINRKTLAHLAPGSVLINTARGGCVDEKALLDSLESGKLAGAGLDVSEVEPVSSKDLRTHPRVVWTPHVAYYSVEGYREMRMKGAEEGLRILVGSKALNPVNLRWLQAPRMPSAIPTILAN
ncbi:MAG: C-terminal binding protein [Planctomycetota bacterium]